MLYKRPKTKFWWCKFTAPNGRQVRKSTKTVDRKAAQEFEDKFRASLWRVTQLGDKPRRTWKEAVVRWLEETKEIKSRADTKHHLRWVSPYLQNCYLDEINRDLLDTISAAKLKTGVKPATVNRMMEVVRVILNRAAREWEWTEKAPYVRMLREPKRRIRWLKPNEVARLLTALPEHLVATVRFSLSTGLREANVTGLEWSQVDLTRKVAWIHADQAKGGKSIGVPLNGEAVEVLRQQVGKHHRFVFTYKDRPIAKCNTKAWRNALVEVGISDFRWHDLRHTWASWHIQNGTPLYVLQELGGWSDIRMVQRYAHLAPEHLSRYADKLSGMSGFGGTLLGTPNIADKKTA